MRFDDHLVVVRGGGDLASGVVYQLHRAGFPVVVAELESPLVIRRTVAFASAVDEGSIMIEGIKGVLAESPSDAKALTAAGSVPVLVSPGLPVFEPAPSVVVDARMAKRNLDTRLKQAPLVIGLGPGFVAGVDCDVVIETKRGHRLGRVISSGSAEPDTGIPGDVGGVSVDRVVRATMDGRIEWKVSIGDEVSKGELIGDVDGEAISAPIAGVVRGLITPGFDAHSGLKIGDIDPRADFDACFEISDKARLVGAGVLGAVFEWLNGEHR